MRRKVSNETLENEIIDLNKSIMTILDRQEALMNECEESIMNNGFNCLSVYNAHDDKVVCTVCGINMCKKCNLHYFWESNNFDTKILYCPIHLNQKHGKLTLHSFSNGGIK